MDRYTKPHIKDYSIRFSIVFIYPELSLMFADGRITQYNKDEILERIVPG